MKYLIIIGFLIISLKSVSQAPQANIPCDGGCIVGNCPIGHICDPFDCMCDEALPIELKTFNGKCDYNGIKLIWITSSEVNNNYFEIERSDNTTDFEVIGTVNGMGNTSTGYSYSFTDKEILNNVNYYYRLKQIDFNGEYSYSYIIGVKCSINDNRYEIIGFYDILGRKISEESLKGIYYIQFKSGIRKVAVF